MSACFICPRRCGADREKGEKGICGADDEMRISRAAPHFFEEPVISGSRGSGTIFFSGCALGCVFCQNRDISRNADAGSPVSVEGLCDMILRLEERGVHNINLVTPSHHTPKIRAALEKIKDRLSIPVLWNSSGYELPETLRTLEGLVDVYLPDLKYFSSELSAKYSGAPDYFENASRAIGEMYRQTGRYELDENGILMRGLVVRHLLLPSSRADSICVLKALADLLPPKDILLSLMSQYTPDFLDEDSPYKALKRRVTSFEYSSLLAVADELGFDGFMQGRSAAEAKYTPDFNDNLDGVMPFSDN